MIVECFLLSIQLKLLLSVYHLVVPLLLLIITSHSNLNMDCTIKALLTRKISALITHTPKTHIPQRLIGFSNPEICHVISWPVVSVPQNPHAHKFKCETRRPLSRVMGYEGFDCSTSVWQEIISAVLRNAASCRIYRTLQ